MSLAISLGCTRPLLDLRRANAPMITKALYFGLGMVLLIVVFHYWSCYSDGKFEYEKTKIDYRKTEIEMETAILIARIENGGAENAWKGYESTPQNHRLH